MRALPADFAPYLVLSPGETYLLPSSGTLSDACVADGGVLSVQVLGGAVLVAAEDAGVTTLLLETTTPFGTTVYEERTVVVAEGGTYCWPCTPYSDSKDMLINRGWGVNGHKGIDVNYNKDYLTDSVAYTFAPGKVVGVFHYDRNTYGKWSGSDTYNKFNYSLAKEYPDIPGLYNTEVGGGAATRGNSVVMEHTIGGETVYSEIFHLQPGSSILPWPAWPRGRSCLRERLSQLWATPDSPGAPRVSICIFSSPPGRWMGMAGEMPSTPNRCWARISNRG